MYTDDMIQRLREIGKNEIEIADIVAEDLALDKHIQKDAYKAWLNVLVTMWDAVDKDVDDKRLSVYAEQFKGIPLGLLELAVARAIRNNGVYLSVPSVGALWNAIQQETGNLPNMDVMEAVQLWKERRGDLFERSIYRFEQPIAVVADVAVETEVV